MCCSNEQKELKVVADTIGDLIQITDVQTYLGQTVLNVWYYIVDTIGTGITPYGDVILSAFAENVLPGIVAQQHPDLIHTHRDFRNLTNALDIATDTEAIPGILDEGDPVASFTSLGVMLLRTSLLTRNGYKRFAGLAEDRISGNTYTFGSGEQVALEESCAMPITYNTTGLLEPVIVKRPIPTPAVGFVYSLLGGASFRGVGTQNTRKPNRGS